MCAVLRMDEIKISHNQKILIIYSDDYIVVFIGWEGAPGRAS